MQIQSVSSDFETPGAVTLYHHSNLIRHGIIIESIFSPVVIVKV